MDIPFKFRDYAVHLFPGLVFMIGIYEVFPAIQVQLKTNPVSGIIIVVVLGYFIGFLSDSITHSTTRKIIRKFKWFRDPFKVEWEKALSNKNTLHAHAINLLQKDIGADIVDNEKVNRLIYYCLRRIENDASNKLSDLPNRILSLENITVNLIPPLLFLTIILIIKGFFLWAILTTVALVSMPFRNTQYRRWLLRVILASYVVIAKNNSTN